MEQGSFIRDGLGFLGQIPWSTHLCQFYHQKEDLFETLVPFFESGLRQNEYCLWILPQEEFREPALERLSERIKGFTRHLRDGRMDILSAGDWYLGKGIDSGRLVRQLKSHIRKKVGRKGQGVRAAGGIHRIETGDWRPFLDYERLIHEKIGEFRMVAVCTYSLANCPLRLIPKVIECHHKTYLKKGWRWDVVQANDVA